MSMRLFLSASMAVNVILSVLLFRHFGRAAGVAQDGMVRP